MRFNKIFSCLLAAAAVSLLLSAEAEAGARIKTLPLRSLTLHQAGHQASESTAKALAPRKAEGLSKQQRGVGYVSDDDIDVSGAGFGQAISVPIGALVGPSILSSYEGCRIIGLRYAVSQSIGRQRAFVSRIADDGSLQTLHEQMQRSYAGWNNVFFNGFDIEIDGTEELFFGFDYVETQDMVDADEGALCGAGDYEEGGCYIFGNFGSGQGLYSISGIGNLCVQLIVDISSLPSKDIDLQSLDIGFRYKSSRDNLDLYATFANVGTDTVCSYVIACRVDSLAPQLLAYSDTLAPGKRDGQNTVFRMPENIQTGRHTMTVYIESIDGEHIATPRGDTIQRPFAVYSEAVSRTHTYMETYTDANNYLSAMQNNVLEKMKTMNGERLVAVNVHRPGTPLAIDEAAWLDDIYAYDHPTFTMNRAYFPAEPYIAYDMNDYLSQGVDADMCAAILTDMVDQEMQSISFARLSAISLAFDDASRRLSVAVEGTVSPDAVKIFEGVAAVAMLVEDGVKGSQYVANARTGMVSLNRNYTHNDVLRSFISSPKGDIVAIDDGLTVRKEFEAQVPESLAKENLRVVVLLTQVSENINAYNAADYDILDCISMRLADIVPEAVTQAKTDDGAPDGRFNLLGMKTGTKAKGIVVERKDGKVRKVLR